jgi:hypothetical protein
MNYSQYKHRLERGLPLGRQSYLQSKTNKNFQNKKEGRVVLASLQYVRKQVLKLKQRNKLN